MVNSGIIIWLVASHSLRRALLRDHFAASMRSSRSIGSAGFDGLVTEGSVGGDKTSIDRQSKSAWPETGRSSDPEQRHDDR